MIKNKVRSSKTSLFDLMTMKRKILHGEIKIKFLINVFFLPYLDMIDHSLLLDYSDSHLRAQVKEINSYLAIHKMSIEFDKIKKGYYLKAENKLLMITFISELVKVSENEHFLPNLTELEIKEFEQFISEFTNFVPPLLLRELLRLTKLQKTLVLQENLIMEQSNSKSTIKENMMKLRNLYPFFLEPHLKQLQFNVDENEFDKLIDIFVITSLKLQASPIRVDNFLNRYDYFYEAFLKENPQIVEIYENAVTQLQIKTGFNFTEYKTELLFHIYTNIKSLRKYKIFNIGVFSDMGDAHTESIILALEKNFTVHKFTKFEVLSKYDLVITTTDNSDQITLNENEFVKVADYISHQDVYNIYNKIYN